jgi:NitT/TauT family transport system substrate-binding protein
LEETVKLTSAIGAIAVTALLLTGCASNDAGGEGSEGETDLVYVGAAAVPGSTQIGLWAVPSELGFFEEEGLEVTQELADGSTAALQVVASGSADYTNAGVVSVMAAVNTGVPVKAFAGVVQNYPWRMATLAGSDVTSPSDFEGKTIGVISLASESNVFARAWAGENGLDVESDVTFVPVGAGAPALAALESGEIDGIALYEEMYASLETAGAEFEYFESPELFDEMPSIALAARTDMIDSEGDVLERAARAMYKGLLFAWANPEAAVRIGYEYYPEKLPESGDPEERIDVDTRIFEAWIASVMPPEGDPLEWGDFGAIEQSVLEDVQEFALAGGQLTEEVEIDEVWTDQFIEAINDFDRQEILDLAESWTPSD